MKKYMATIEFRYTEIPKSEYFSSHTNKVITIGIFDDFDRACVEGNKVLEMLESKFPLHVFPKGRGTAKRERLSKTGGPFGSKNNLVSNLAYLQTPFQFFVKIDTLVLDDVEEVVDNVVDSVSKYRLANIKE